MDIWQVTFTPVVDFNGDGKIGATDRDILLSNWGRSQLLCDIAPLPLGDGVVDGRDLAVLDEYMGARGLAVADCPQSQAVEVPCDVVLTWIPGDFAQTHDVYFGTSLEAVAVADRGTPLGVLVSQGQDPNTYDPAGLLAFAQTYYWRIDEVNAAPDFTIYRGGVLSFTTEAFAYPIPKVTATASSALSNMGAEKTVDGSGLDESNGHSANGADMWQSAAVGPHWIEFEFDRVYALHELWVWNSNSAGEPVLGFGAKTVRIEYSTEGTNWTALADVPEFARAPGQPGYVADTVVGFGGVSAQFVKLTIEKGWGVTPSVGLSEVRFFHIPDRPAPEP
jgi:hypothetical protein